jgi:hypothetical protein
MTRIDQTITSQVSNSDRVLEPYTGVVTMSMDSRRLSRNHPGAVGSSARYQDHP